MYGSIVYVHCMATLFIHIIMRALIVSIKYSMCASTVYVGVWVPVKTA